MLNTTEENFFKTDPVLSDITHNVPFFFFYLGFTPCKADWQLRDMELQEKDTQKD